MILANNTLAQLSFKLNLPPPFALDNSSLTSSQHCISAADGRPQYKLLPGQHAAVNSNRDYTVFQIIVSSQNLLCICIVNDSMFIIYDLQITIVFRLTPDVASQCSEDGVENERKLWIKRELAIEYDNGTSQVHFKLLTINNFYLKFNRC